MLRTSSYTIYVSLPEDQEHMLLVHGYSGAYDKVSRPVAEYLLSCEAGVPPKPLYGEWCSEPALQRPDDAADTPSDDTIAALVRRGYLTAMSVPEEEGYVARIIKKGHARSVQSVNYIFMPTYDCNLRCAYCFQDHMRTKREFSHLLRTMSPDIVDRIFAAMPTIERQHGVSPEYKRNIGFFGGEPLLRTNRSIVEYIMGKARSLGPAEFWAVSNATELDAYTDLLGPQGIAQVQITLDGPPDEHDRRRIRPDGSGSYAQIAPNIDRCLSLGVRVSIRVNLDPANIADAPRLADEIVARGWDRSAGFSVYTAPIVPNDHVPVEKTFDRWKLDQEIDALRLQHPAMRVIGRPDDGMQAWARRLFDQRQNLPSLKTAFCSAHTGMYIFDIFGDIYACWERTGDARIRIGRVLDDGNVELNALAKTWRARTPASNPTCRKCRYAFQCGGGCAVLAEGQTGKFFANYCDGYANRFRHSVAKAYLDHVNGVPVREQVTVTDL